jgi:hypothetical protein
MKLQVLLIWIKSLYFAEATEKQATEFTTLLKQNYYIKFRKEHRFYNMMFSTNTIRKSVDALHQNVGA